MGNPSWPLHHQDSNHARPALHGANPSVGKFGQDGSASVSRHCQVSSTDWTQEQQEILEKGLVKYSSNLPVTRYANIALELGNKNIRDVAMRCKWMTERQMSPLVKASRVAAPSSASPEMQLDSTDRIMFDDGVAVELLRQNAFAFIRTSANLSDGKILNNIRLFCQLRENLLKIINELNTGPEPMKRMPWFPDEINMNLSNTILPPWNLTTE